MEVDKPPRVLLKDISSFLSNHKDDRTASLEERTNCAIILLEALPCARYAVLEKIGEVFFDEAQKYVVELEKLHLAGMPPIYEAPPSTLDVQIKKIQHVLVSFVEGNSKAWGPMIYQWTVNMLSQICSQYATKRQFSNISLEERFQLWLNCKATSVLLEIMVSCLHRIIDKDQVNCIKILLNAMLSSSVYPFFNWVIAHLCCVFPHIFPYTLLCLATEVFNVPSRRLQDTMLSIFDLLHPHRQEHVNAAIMRLFTESLSNEKDNHVALRTIPFLLHIATKSINLFKPLTCKLLESLTHECLQVLQEQSLRRDEVVQRRCVAMVADCIHDIDTYPEKILDFLVKYSCQEDYILIEGDPMLAATTQSFCSVVLQTLICRFTTEISVHLHYNKSEILCLNGEPVSVSPFLVSLGKHVKQLCKQMLNSSGTKRDLLQEILKLFAVQDGVEKMTEILTFVLVNSSLHVSKSCLTYLLKEFKTHEPTVLRKTLNNVFMTMVSRGSGYSANQILTFLKNIQRLDSEMKSGFLQKISLRSSLKFFVKYIAQIVAESDGDAPIVGMELLQKLCVSDLHISEYAIIVQSVLRYYFKRTKKMAAQGCVGECFSEIKCCNQLLLRTVNQYGNVHQHVIRLLLEGLLTREEEEFSTESEEPLIKVELMKQNLDMVQKNRYGTITSVTFKNGLKLPEKFNNDYQQWKSIHTRQLFLNTLSSLLSMSSYGARMSDSTSKGNKFTHHWGEKRYMLIHPASHAHAATVLVELICPEMIPVMPWPDEDSLKYTIERDLKVKNMFDKQPVLWDVLGLISCARPSLFHCSVLVQSLFGMTLKFWQRSRNPTTLSSSVELNNTYQLMNVIRNAGWLPTQIDTISDIFPFIKPKEVYDILSSIWNYLRNTSFAPDRFIDRDQLGLPSVPVNNDFLQNAKAVIQIVFLRNIEKIGHMYHRFYADQH